MTEFITLLKLCGLVVIFLMLLAAAMLLIAFIVTTIGILKEQQSDKVRTGKAKKKDSEEDKEGEKDV